MSKIICDVCGSSYSDTEANCPICGTAKSEEAKPVVETEQQEQTPKAGRYSRTNSGRQSGRNKNSSAQEAPSNLAMIIIVAVLLLAIVVAAVFVLVRLLPDSDDTPSTDASTSTGNIEPPANIPCTGIELVHDANKNLEFTELTAVTLEIKALPENTTDDVVVSCTSDNKAVATAITQADGTVLVTPVANGTAKITITYGDCTPIEVNVTCKLKLEIAHNEVTLTPDRPTVDLYKSSPIAREEITWTSSDETVATVDGGVVTALKNGDITITATIGEQKEECKIHVKEMDKVLKYHTNSPYKTEITLKVGEKWEIYLMDKDGNIVTEGITWTPSGDCKKCCDIVDTENGKSITAKKVTSDPDISGGYALLTIEYKNDEGKTETIKFKIYVKAE